jgi:hypothetical protein
MLDDVAKIRAFFTLAYVLAVAVCAILGLNGVPQELTPH